MKSLLPIYLAALLAAGCAVSREPLDTGSDQFWQAVKSGKPLLR